MSDESPNLFRSTLNKCKRRAVSEHGGLVVRLNSGGCLSKICSYNWNETQVIPLLAPKKTNKPLQFHSSSIATYTVSLDIKTLEAAHTSDRNFAEWNRQHLTSHKVDIIPSVDEDFTDNDKTFCELSSPTNSVKTFDGLTYALNAEGI